MARKQDNPVGDALNAVTTLPWYVGVSIAAVIWIIGMVVGAGGAKNAVDASLRPIFALVLKGFSILTLVAAGLSAMRNLSRKALVDGQKGIETLRAVSWREFETLVGEAYRRQGYDVEETGGGGADGGVDLILRGHGETVLVQCKQWKERQVGVTKVRELFGVLTAEGANRGILVTSGNFTNDAQSFKVGKPLILVDGPALAQLVRDVQPAKPVVQPAATKQPTPSAPATPMCPQCGSPMVLRTAKRGANAGSSFYGCTKYPACKGTQPTD